MPRQPRPDLAGVPQHVVQRGNDRQACFFEDADYRAYLTGLREASLRYGCLVHAYVLMTNHVHLLLTPSARGGVSRMMQWLGRNYVGHVNVRYRRTGTLWEGRYKSCLVDTDHYLLTCYRYIELNPVRAAMVATPGEYRWSSYHANADGAGDPLIRFHPEYLRLGPDLAARQRAYRTLFDDVLTPERVTEIRAYLQQQRVLGSEPFQRQVEAMLGRCAQVRPAHRPVAEKNGR
jgi:putative transposase